MADMFVAIAAVQVETYYLTGAWGVSVGGAVESGNARTRIAHGHARGESATGSVIARTCNGHLYGTIDTGNAKARR